MNVFEERSIVPRRLTAVVVAIGLSAVLALTFVSPAPAYHGPARPNQPYTLPTYEPELQPLIRAKQTTDLSFPAEWAKPKWWRIGVRVFRFPGLRALGAVGVTIGGVDAGWRIYRSSTDGSWDPIWARITGTELGTLPPVPPSCVAHGAYWSFSPNARVGGHVPANSWLFRPYCNGVGSSVAAWCRFGEGSCTMAVGLHHMAEDPSLPGTVATVPRTNCLGDTSNITCKVRYLSESAFEALAAPKQLERYTSQPLGRHPTTGQPYSTNYAVPAPLLTAAELDVAREAINHEGEALENEINGQLDAESWQRPGPYSTPVGQEPPIPGGPRADWSWPSPEFTETYPEYLERLRQLGWLGTATVVELDSDDGEPEYRASGIPCTDVLSGSRIWPGTPVTFFRNPTTFAAAGSIPGGIACGAADATSATSDECSFQDWPWEAALTVNPLFYQLACEEAWSYVRSFGEFVTADGKLNRTVFQPFPLTAGRDLKNPEVIDRLTQRRAPVQDWEKARSQAFGTGERRFELHFYRHTGTDEVELSIDFKIKFLQRFYP